MQGEREQADGIAPRVGAPDVAIELLPRRAGADGQQPALKLPAARVELLPAVGYVERLRDRRRPGWIATIAIAVAALAVGVAGTLAVHHTDDVSRQQRGYRSGWQAGYNAGSSGAFDSGYKKGNQAGWSAGYQRGLQEGCRALRGADASCDSTILPAGVGVENHTAPTFRG